MRPWCDHFSSCHAALAGLCLALLCPLLPACEGVPVCVPGDTCPWLPEELTVAVGGLHACWIRPDHSLWCWGDNGAGQLGLLNDPGESVPTRVGNGSSWNVIAAGFQHTCAIRFDGSLWCWGWNGFGQATATATCRRSRISAR